MTLISLGIMPITFQEIPDTAGGMYLIGNLRSTPFERRGGQHGEYRNPYVSLNSESSQFLPPGSHVTIRRSQYNPLVRWQNNLLEILAWIPVRRVI